METTKAMLAAYLLYREVTGYDDLKVIEFDDCGTVIRCTVESSQCCIEGPDTYDIQLFDLLVYVWEVANG